MAKLSDILRPLHAGGARPPKTAFVLSGGAAMGALQVGMLRALIELRIRPDLVLGCSVGALNGVVVASDPSLAAVGRLQDIWMDLVARDLLPAGFLPSTMQLVRKGASIQSSDALQRLISEMLPVETFEELSIPFQCVATDVDGATEHWFSTGHLVNALLASSSIPAVFPPVVIAGRRYLDGGVVDDVPVSRAVALGATKIYILQVGGVDRPRPEPRRPLDMAVLAYWIARRSRLLDDLSRIPEDVEVIVLPHGNPLPVRYNDLSRSAQLMDKAYRSAKHNLGARASGDIPVKLGPLYEDDLPISSESDTTDEVAELGLAQELVAAAAHDPADPGTHDPPRSTEAELLSRAETLGPAMRAVIERVRDRGDRAIARVRERLESDDEADGDDDATDAPATDG